MGSHGHRGSHQLWWQLPGWLWVDQMHDCGRAVPASPHSRLPAHRTGRGRERVGAGAARLSSLMAPGDSLLAELWAEGEGKQRLSE